LYHPDESLILKTLKAKIPVTKAGGGLVYNKKGEVLFILETENGICLKAELKRREIEATAMREVEEETGVNRLSISHKLQNYHVLDVMANIN
jgi:8-oxo-dGTP pyrophosphatase MutT (NUDIX family)